MPSGLVASEERFVKVSRRFLLFQVALNSPSLSSVMAPRSSNASRTPSQDFRISDPVDYDNPSSPIYWRNVNRFFDKNNQNLYSNKVREQFKIFLEAFEGALASQHIGLNSNSGLPYLDISDFIKNVEGYSTRLDGMDNQVTLVIAKKESNLASRPAPGQIFVDFTDDVIGSINPQENDIVMVKVAYGQDADFETEFMGLITKVNKTFSYGSVDGYILKVFGISKMLYTSQMVAQKSLNPQEFIPGIELNRADAPSPYENRFNDKDVKALFDFLLTDSLSCKQAFDLEPSTTLMRMDPRPFISFKNFGFQHNIFVLLALYLMAVTEAPSGIDGSLESRLFPQVKPNSDTFNVTNRITAEFNSEATATANANGLAPRTAKRPLLDQPVRGVVERSGHKVYNEMVSKGADKFFSQMDIPANIMDHIRSNSYSDVFESRDGIIVCRPPRCNKVERTFSEFDRESAEDDFKNLLQFTSPNVYEFNPDSDFVIRAEELVKPINIDRDDMALESRVDVKFIIPFAGVKDFPTGLYIDPDILFRYGLRSHGPISNPNAYNSKLARIFAPISLAMTNAPTRTFDIEVKDSRKFYIGKLYYIESIDMVGFLVQDTINHAYGALSTKTLAFSFVRSVIRRPISEILKSNNEVLNVAMMYLDDFPTSEDLEQLISEKNVDTSRRYDPEATGKFTVKDYMYSKGYQFLLDLKSGAASLSGNAEEAPSTVSTPGGDISTTADVKLVMFKYVPNIEDLIMELESNPVMAEAPIQGEGTTTDSLEQRKENRLRVQLDDALNLYATTGFKNLSYGYDGFTSRIDGIFRSFKSSDVEAAGGNPVKVNYQLSPNSPFVVAGLLGYLGTSFPVVSTNPQVIQTTGNTDNFINALRSPFNAQSISNPAQNIALSQVLANMLVDLDLNMKFRKDGSSGISMRNDGIQQLYFLGASNDFNLFGSDMRPSQYFDSLKTVSGASLPVLGVFQHQMLSYLGCLKLNKDGDKFENDFFSIPMRNGGFDLPYGHLILKQSVDPVTGYNFGDLAFLKIKGSFSSREGGRFRVAYGKKSGEIDMSPLDARSKIQLEDSSGLNIGINDPEIVRSAPGGVYFISPFLEPTIERLFDVYLDPKIGGNLSSSEAESQKKLSTKGALGNLAKRQAGRAVNVCPEALFVASGSNIQIKGMPTSFPTGVDFGSSSLPNFYYRFEQLILEYFSSQVARVKDRFRIPNGISMNLILPDGTNLGSKSMVVYNLNIDSLDEDAYVSKIQSASNTKV